MARLQEDWSVATVQRRLHRRLDQWRGPRTEVVWTGTPRPGATNERPHVFDLNLTATARRVRGDAQFMDRNGPGIYRAQSPPSGLQGTTEHLARRTRWPPSSSSSDWWCASRASARRRSPSSSDQGEAEGGQ